MSVKKCPFCAEEIAAEAIKCKHCGSMLDGRETVFDYPPVIITGPVLVSAIWNLLTFAWWGFAGISWLPCFGLLIAASYAILAYYEITTFQRAETMPPRELYDRCGILSIVQIVLGLTNALPVICGVLLLVYRDKLLLYEETPPVVRE
ncbi:MAG: hypothetical protein KDA86_26215 [Planctomycetaceae bacterium]|nr:hypothetical protein [Planctomycetaceae bacterium]MCA9077282.1 hypothetical protein [Planctomycetaceae bacterium]